MNKPKKRHHYIPVFHLKGFTNSNGCLWVYDKEGKGLFEAAPDSIAFEKHYFSFMDETGKRDSETVENMIMQIESESAGVVRKILAEKELTEDERVTFGCFVASMMVRAPNFRDNIRSSMGEMIKQTSVFMAAHKENFKQMVQRFEKDTGEKIDMPVEKLRQWMLNKDKYTVSINPQHAMAMALSQIEHLSRIFANMNWAFLKADGGNMFMTGDNPLQYIDPTHNPRSFYGVGLANKNVEVTLPLSKDMAALGRWEKLGGFKRAEARHVKHINRMTVMASVRFVFSDKKSGDLDRFVKKYKGSHPIMKVG